MANTIGSKHLTTRAKTE